MRVLRWPRSPVVTSLIGFRLLGPLGRLALGLRGIRLVRALARIWRLADSHGLAGRDAQLPPSHEGHYPGDVVPDIANLTVVVELADGQFEAELVELTPAVAQLLRQLVHLHGRQFGGLHTPTSSGSVAA